MMSRERPDGPETPTGAALVLAATAPLVALLARQVPGESVALSIGCLGAIGFVATLRVIASDAAPRPVALSVGLAAAPVGIALAVGAFGAALSAIAAAFPVETPAGWSSGALTVLGRVGTVLGCMLAALGAALAASGPASSALLGRYARLAVLSSLVPALTGAVLLARATVSPRPTPGIEWAFGLAVVGIAVAGVAVVLRRAARAGGVRPSVPVLAGGISLAVAVGVSDRALPRAIRAVTDRLPGALGADVSAAATGLVGVYGADALSALLLAGFASATALVAAALRGGPPDGSALAAAGLLLGTVAASTVGAPAALTFAGVAGCLFVWEAGAFAAGLRDEVGRLASTRRVEAVHAGGTAVAVALGALGAWGVARLGARGLAPDEPAFGALAFVGVGIALLILAAR